MTLEETITAFRNRNRDLLIDHVIHGQSYTDLGRKINTTRQRAYQLVFGIARRIHKMSDSEKDLFLSPNKYDGEIKRFCEHVVSR